MCGRLRGGGIEQNGKRLMDMASSVFVDCRRNRGIRDEVVMEKYNEKIKNKTKTYIIYFQYQAFFSSIGKTKLFLLLVKYSNNKILVTLFH